MRVLIDHLLKSRLFKGIDAITIRSHLQLHSCQIVEYRKGATVAQEGDPFHSIGLLLEGVLAMNQLTAEGDCHIISMIPVGTEIGLSLLRIPEAIYPFQIISRKRSLVLYIPATQIESLLQHNLLFNRNYINSLSSLVLHYAYEMERLHLRSVRARLIHYLASEYIREGSNPFLLRYKKIDIADILGIARPSISRELHLMELDGLIQVNGQSITLLVPELFSISSVRYDP